MSKFQKRHYEAIADILGDPEIPGPLAQTITSRFIDLFTYDNHRFDKNRFLDAIQQHFEYRRAQESD